MDELEEILYQYRCGLRELPTYEELSKLSTITNRKIQESYDQGYEEGSNDAYRG